MKNILRNLPDLDLLPPEESLHQIRLTKSLKRKLDDRSMVSIVQSGKKRSVQYGSHNY